MTIYRINLSGTAYVKAASKEDAVDQAMEFIEDLEFETIVTLASEPAPVGLVGEEDQLVISRSWLRGLHETAIHEFNQAPSDRPTFRSGYWNGYAMAIGAILKFFINGSPQPH